MMFKSILLIAVSMTLVSSQRPSFAGSRPIGFPAVVKPPTPDDLANRFGDDDVPTTTVKLPLEANGDRDLVERLSKLPIDQQPFWLINWRALEAQRKNPQTFEQRPNVFANSQQPEQASSQALTMQGTNVVQSTGSTQRFQNSQQRRFRYFLSA